MELQSYSAFCFVLLMHSAELSVKGERRPGGSESADPQAWAAVFFLSAQVLSAVKSCCDPRGNEEEGQSL